MEDFNVYDVAHRLRSIDMFPFFDIANSVKVAMLFRASLGSKFVEFSSTHPITCWAITILSQSVGGIVSSLLLGKPAVGIFSDPYRLSMATAIWILVFYTDFYSLAYFCPIALVYSTMAELHRANRIIRGVSAAAEVYPTSYVTMILIGTIAGNGKDAVRIISTLINRLKHPNSTETVQMSPWTKLSILAATFFTFTRLYTANEDAFRDAFPKIPAPLIMLDLVFMAVVLLFELFMLANFMNLTFDPFAPLSYITRYTLAPQVRIDKKKLH